MLDKGSGRAAGARGIQATLHRGWEPTPGAGLPRRGPGRAAAPSGFPVAVPKDPRASLGCERLAQALGDRG